MAESDNNRRVDFLVIGGDHAVVQRCETTVSTFDFSFLSLKSADELVESSESLSAKFVVLIATASDVKDQIANLTQIAKQCCPDAYILVVVGKRIAPEAAVFTKKSGANYVMLENEFLESSKLEFIASQAIRTAYVGIKSSELKVDTAIPFNVYHLMPINKKYLHAVRAGDVLSAKKQTKIQGVSELYCYREDLGAYAKYISENTDRSAEGLKSRCRSQFLMLTAEFIELTLLITDQSEIASFDKGRKLYEKCQATASEMLANLGAVGDAWDVITNSAIGSFAVDRSPAIAAYAGLFSLMMDMGDANDIVLAALLADVGLLDLTPTLQIKIAKKEPLSDEELKEYQRHPVNSLNRCLSRKLPIPEPMKKMITMTHERADGKGFQQVPAEKIPLAAQLIQLSQMIDDATSIKWGSERKNPAEVRRMVIQREAGSGAFSPELITKVQQVCATHEP